MTFPASFYAGNTRSFTFNSQGNRVYYSAPSITASGSTWWDGVCTNGESRYAIVKDYPRANAHQRMERTYARMYCGKELRESEQPYSEAAFGIRHIRLRHRSQFAKLAAMQGSTWGNWMHWALRWTMSEPSQRSVEGPNRFCYFKKFGFQNVDGEVVNKWVYVILGKTGVRIMTAFPRNNNYYCDGNQF